MSAEPAAGKHVVGFFHGGINVADLDRSLGFYRDVLGLDVLWERVFAEPYIFEIIGQHAEQVRAAYLRVPGSEPCSSCSSTGLAASADAAPGADGRRSWAPLLLCR